MTTQLPIHLVDVSGPTQAPCGFAPQVSWIGWWSTALGDVTCPMCCRFIADGVEL